MKLRIPRRRWGIQYTLTTPHGVDPPYISPARYWTQAGARYIADQERELYAGAPLLRNRMAIDVVECGPFDEAAYLAYLEQADHLLRRPPADPRESETDQ